MKSYGSTFVTFPSHLAQREETCQKSLHQRQNTHTYLQMYYWSDTERSQKKSQYFYIFYSFVFLMTYFHIKYHIKYLNNLSSNKTYNYQPTNFDIKKLKFSLYELCSN